MKKKGKRFYCLITDNKNKVIECPSFATRKDAREYGFYLKQGNRRINTKVYPNLWGKCSCGRPATKKTGGCDYH